MKKQLVALGVIVAISGGVLTAVSLHKEEPQKSVSQKKASQKSSTKNDSHSVGSATSNAEQAISSDSVNSVSADNESGRNTETNSSEASHVGEYSAVQGSPNDDKVVGNTTVSIEDIEAARQSIGAINQTDANAMSNADIAMMIVNAKKAGQTVTEYYNATSHH